MALCSLSIGSNGLFCRRASAVISSPAATRHSLLARPTSLPARTASYVAFRPATPTIALTTKSTSLCVATRTVPACPLTISMCPSPSVFSCALTFSAFRSEASERTLGVQRRACSSADSAFDPAAIVTSSKRSGWFSITLSVLWPMEPVDPRMAMRFIIIRILFECFAEESGQIRIVPHHRNGEEQRVDAVEHAAVAGKKSAGILKAGATLQCGFKEITELCGDVGENAECSNMHPRYARSGKFTGNWEEPVE